MMKNHLGVVIGLAFSIGLVALGSWLRVDSTSRAADQDAGAGDPIKFERLVLYDSQPLWGGQHVFVLADGTLWVQVLKPPAAAGEEGMQEKRYKLALKPAQVAELQSFLGEHHFSDIRIKERFGIPDEVHILIQLTSADGKTVQKSKWANDKNEDFDAIHRRLLELVPRPGSETPVYAGKLDLKWHPEGFKPQGRCE